jgi:LysM repeat protein
VERPRLSAARLAAPAAFLLAATIAVLLVRSAIDAGAEAPVLPTTAPPATTAGVTTVETEPAEPPPPTTTESSAAFYTIESGDTLESVADQYGTTVEALFELNPEIDPRALTVGQRIRVQ